MKRISRRSALALAAGVFTAGCAEDGFSGVDDISDDGDVWETTPDLDREFQVFVEYEYDEIATDGNDDLETEVEEVVVGDHDYPPLEQTAELLVVPTETDASDDPLIGVGSYDVAALSDELTDPSTAESAEVEGDVVRAETDVHEIAFTSTTFVRAPIGDDAFESIVAVLTGEEPSLYGSDDDFETLVDVAPDGLASVVARGQSEWMDEEYPELPALAGAVRTLTHFSAGEEEGTIAVLFEDADDVDRETALEAMHAYFGTFYVDDPESVELDPERPRLATAAYDLTFEEDEATDGDEEKDEATDDEYALEPGTAIEVAGYTSHWEGIAPSVIDGAENPTFVLEEGETYEIGWTEGDGAMHNIEIRNGDDEVVDGLQTELTADPGDDQWLEFEASEELAYYVCDPHEITMRGEIVVADE